MPDSPAPSQASFRAIFSRYIPLSAPPPPTFGLRKLLGGCPISPFRFLRPRPALAATALILVAAVSLTTFLPPPAAAQEPEPVDTPTQGICDRTAKVQALLINEIAREIARFGHTRTCEEVTAEDLASITTIFDPFTYLTTLQPGDLDGLTQLQSLRLYLGGEITELPAGLFAETPNLEVLSLPRQKIGELPAGIFDDVPKLGALNLNASELTSLPEEVFEHTPNLRILELADNKLAAVSKDTLDDVPELEILNLHHNRLTELPDNLFDNHTKLRDLDLSANRIAALHEDTFDGLSQLTNLNLSNNKLPKLPEDVFEGLSNLTILELQDNPFTSVPVDVFEGLTSLTSLWTNLPNVSPEYFEHVPQLTKLFVIAGSQSIPEDSFHKLTDLERLTLGYGDITSLPADAFDGLSKLKWLDLAGNQLTSLDEDIFDGLTSLESLRLLGNELTSLHEDIFDGLTSLETLKLGSNQESTRFSTLPANLFADLAKLKTLSISEAGLDTLPEGAFNGLEAVERIDLSVNYLRSLPAGLFEGITKLNNLGLRQTQISTPVDPPAWAVELGLDPDMFRIRTGDETLVFHVHPELVQGNRIVAKVIEGAPFDISVMLSAEGGTLSANQVTIPAGSIKSPPVTVTPLSADRGMVTVKVTYAIFEGWDTFDHPAGACDCWGFRTGPGDPITVDATFATITGEPRVGETLTADTSYIQDPDGMENAEFSYQWVREDSGTETDIENATDSAYTIVAADVGKTITVRVSFTDDAGNEESLTSAETAAVAAIVPTQPLGLTVTRGDQTQELDASWQAPSSNGGSAITGYKVQWKEVADSWGTATGISEVAVTVTGTTYTITGLTGEVEYAIRVIATNEVGDGPPSGEQTGTPRETVPPDFKGPPSVDGATLLVSYDEALDEDSVPAADAFVLKVVLRGGSMYWQDESARRAVDGVSVTGSAVVLILAKAVTAEEYVVLSYTPPSDATAPRTRDVAGNAAPGFRPVQVSNNTEEAPEDKNPAPNTPATGEPTVSGTAQVGETLTADVSRIADEDGRENAEFSYQWLADDAEIQDATGSAYTLVAADEGKTVKVRVSFTDDEGHAETRTSTPTGAVAPNVGPRSRSVAENTAEGSDIGAPVAAGDSDGPVTYKLGGNGAASFDVVASTGQLQTKAALDYESKSSYGVTVIATDSDGTRTIPVTIEVTNVPELLPLVTGPASLGYEENGAGRVATYTASSAEDREGITWSLSGPDSDSFSVNRGILRFDIEPVAPNIFLQLPDFEGPVDVDGNNSYSVTVAASDGTNVITKDVTVTVGDQDEIGTLTLSTVRPQVDVPLTATLSDPDTVTGTTQWTWERSAGRNHWMVIDGANSAMLHTGGRRHAGIPARDGDLR